MAQLLLKIEKSVTSFMPKSEESKNPSPDPQAHRLYEGVTNLEQTLNYCHKSYIHCSEQRLTTFRYFIVYIAAVTYAFYELQEHSKQLHLYTFILLICSLIISYAFYKLEIRNQNIVQVTEDGCKEIESLISLDVCRESERR